MSLLVFFSKVEDLGVWPDGLLDASVTMIPKTDGDSTPLGQRPLSVLLVVYRIWASARMGQLDDWFKSWVPDSVLVLGGGREEGFVDRLRPGIPLLLILKRFFLVLLIPMFTFLLLMSSSLLTRWNRGILDRVLSSLGLPGWFRHAYFEYHVHVRLRFKACIWPWSVLDSGWGYSSGLSLKYDVSCCFLPHLV